MADLPGIDMSLYLTRTKYVSHSIFFFFLNIKGFNKPIKDWFKAWAPQSYKLRH